MAIYKKGATLLIAIEFTEEEFTAIYPHDTLIAECENSTKEYPLITTFDVPNRTLLLSADTEPFTKGNYKVDVRIEKDGIVIFIPQDTYITFQIIAPVSEVGNEVETDAG